MARRFLSIEGGAVRLDGLVVDSVAAVVLALGPDDEVFASSSLDFPDEYTDTPAVLDLVAALRRLGV